MTRANKTSISSNTDDVIVRSLLAPHFGPFCSDLPLGSARSSHRLAWWGGSLNLVDAKSANRQISKRSPFGP